MSSSSVGGKRPASSELQADYPILQASDAARAARSLAPSYSTPRSVPLPTFSIEGDRHALYYAINRKDTPTALDIIKRLDLSQLSAPNSDGRTPFSLAMHTENGDVAWALARKHIRVLNSLDNADLTEPTAQAFLERFLPKVVVAEVGEYTHELYLDQPREGVPQKIIDATLRALCDRNTDPTPYRSVHCWLRQYSPDDISAFFNSLEEEERVIFLESAVKMSLPSFVETILNLDSRSLSKKCSENGALTALEYGSLDIQEMFSENIDSDEEGSLLGEAAFRGYLQAVQQLCAIYWNWDDVVYYAAGRHHMPIVKWVIENCEPEQEEEYISTALGECVDSDSPYRRGKPLFDWLVTYKKGRYTKYGFIKNEFLAASDQESACKNLRLFFEPPLSSIVHLTPEDVSEALINLLLCNGAEDSLEGAQVLLDNVPADRKEQTAQACWNNLITVTPNFPWEDDKLEEINWLLDSGHITQRFLNQTLISACAENRPKTVSRLLRHQRISSGLNNDIIASSLRLAASLKNWPVIDAIRNSGRYAEATSEEDRLFVEEKEKVYRLSAPASAEEAVAADPPDHGQNL